MYLKKRLNVVTIDKQIGVLMGKLEDLTLDQDKKDLIKEDIESLLSYREKLVDKKTPVRSEFISGAFGVVGILLVLYYEKTDIVTSKAFTMAGKLFRG